MLFSVVIPVFNGAGKIGTTIESILGQRAFFDRGGSVEVFVVDGASGDGTADVARGYDDPRITVISEPDTGMYDALAKGLARTTGEVACYMPAGDIFDDHAMAVVMDVLSAYPQIAWLTGRSSQRNASGQIIESRLPHPYARSLFETGTYGTDLFPLMQESTFWRTRLHTVIDMDRLRGFRLAGDFYLWWSFAKVEPLYVVNSILGFFTFEDNQLSKQTPGAYEAEIRSLARPMRLLERIALFRARRPDRRVIPRSSAPRLVSWDHIQNRWHLRNDRRVANRRPNFRRPFAFLDID